VLVINVMGTLFMQALDDPFQAVTRELAACGLGNGCDVIVIDIHAEASSEKQTMGYFLDGKASLVIGTHTHVPTADWKILPGGTAYMTDVGMCGDYDSIIGMEKDEPLRRATTKIAAGRLMPALRAGTLSGLAVDIDDKTGLARRIAPLRLGPGLAPAEPDFAEAP
jgi:calcineurin-like phosphoesterase